VPALTTDDIAFDDMFALDDLSTKQLNAIAARVRTNPEGVIFDYTAQADEEQQRFIDSQARTIRLLAPAGSGKTQSVVNRVITAVSKGARLDEFLILTFDNAASASLREKMLQRVSSLAVALPGTPQVMTLNRFGYGQFRGVLSDLYGQLTIGENVRRDQMESIRRTLDALKQKRPDVHGLLPRRLGHAVYLQFISAQKNNLVLPDHLFKTEGDGRRRFLDLCEAHRLLDPWLDALGATEWERSGQLVVNALAFIYRHYCWLMRNHNRIDFDDQKLLPYLAFDADERLAKAAMSQYRCVVVDEFQDINLLDFALVRLIAKDRPLIVVGDDDQAIYAFRGCSPRYIIDFAERAGRDTETHVLRVNYRCPRNVVEMSNRLINHNTDRVVKNQRASREDDADVQVWHCLNSGSEAQVIARFVKRLYAERAQHGFQYANVAMLTRMNSQSLPLQIALILEGIPYHCRKEDNVIVSETMEKLLGLIGLHLKLLEKPGHQSPEDTALLVNCFFRYQRPADVEAFHRLVVEKWGYAEAAKDAEKCLRFAWPLSVADFRRAVGVLLKPATPVALVEGVSAAFKNLGGLVGSLEDAINNTLPLGEFVDIASRFRGDTHDFHELMAGLLAKVRGGLFHEAEGDGVNLLTYFRAKGRQWHTVILPGVNERVIPHARSPIEDERRLFYVAVTRATSNLILSYVRQAVRCSVEPSRFLFEMGLASAEEKRAAFIS
jgi:DNA helicase-2/ATP-dependent DNA helicase PcrA